MTRTDQDEYLTKAGLKARGWTEKAIATFLGPCDREAKNPVFRSAAPAKLYRTSRVEAAEQSAAYQAFVAGNAGRRGGARKAVATKRDRLLQELATWQIVLRPKPYEVVVDAAIRAYNRFHEDLYLDRIQDEAAIRRGIQLLQDAGIRTRHEVSVYVLVGFDTTPEEDKYRCRLLKELGATPFVMQYGKRTEWTRKVAWWANRPQVFWMCDVDQLDRSKNRAPGPKSRFRLGDGGNACIET